MQNHQADMLLVDAITLVLSGSCGHGSFVMLPHMYTDRPA